MTPPQGSSADRSGRTLSWGEPATQPTTPPNAQHHAPGVYDEDFVSVIYSDEDILGVDRQQQRLALPHHILAGSEGSTSTVCLSNCFSRSRSRSLSRCYSRSRSHSRMARMCSSSSGTSVAMESRENSLSGKQESAPWRRESSSRNSQLSCSSLQPVSPRPFSPTLTYTGIVEEMHLGGDDGGSLPMLPPPPSHLSGAVSPGVSYSRIGSEKRGARILPAIEEEMVDE